MRSHFPNPRCMLNRSRNRWQSDPEDTYFNVRNPRLFLDIYELFG